MYRYDEFDHGFVADRVKQFRGQVSRRLSGALAEEEFRPLRLMNGVYLQLHAYMLRVAVPYGTLSPRQMRRLADISRRYDRGYGHFTTRQNIQYNWPKLEDVPDILTELADVEMHAIQTSGNCIRNVTADHFAGAAADEIEDPRPWGEIIRQWSSLHPEFSFLPRKFKIAVTGAASDRAAVKTHDIGLRIVRNEHGEHGFEVMIGGGQGRTPMLARTVREFLPQRYLLSYLEAILRVYNLYGRRDNKYKARIKILVHEVGIDEIRERVESEWASMKYEGIDVPGEEIDRIHAYFAPPDFEALPASSAILDAKLQSDEDFARWHRNNVSRHKVDGYAIVTIPLKGGSRTPGDATAEEMEAVANLGERYSFGEIRVSHEQNLILPHVLKDDLPQIWSSLVEAGLASPNAGLVTDIISCPGLDYCTLANARSIPVAQRIAERFADARRQDEIGRLQIKISGCINACGHHHVGHIGILGVDRKGEEYYQVTLGGNADFDADVGKIVGPAFSSDEIVDAVEKIVERYVDLRADRNETFLETYRRIGNDPFKEVLYAAR